MTTYGNRARLLLALFDMTQAGVTIELFSVSENAGLNLYRTLSELAVLGERGLVDPRKWRLTLSGLAVAASLDRRVRSERATLKSPATPAARVYTWSTKGKQSQGSVEQLVRRDLVA